MWLGREINDKGNRVHLLWISTINQFHHTPLQNASHWGNLEQQQSTVWQESSVTKLSGNSLILQTLSPELSSGL